MFKKILKGLLVLLVIVLALVGPSALFWIQWMMPGNDYPDDIDSQVSIESAANSDLAGQLERLLIERRTESGAPSMSAAISRDGALLWAGAVGFAGWACGRTAGGRGLHGLWSQACCRKLLW